MTDWEDEEFEPALPSLKKEPPKDLWVDEDVEDEEVRESWEDEEEPKQAPKQESKEETTVAKPAGKVAGKKTKQPEAKARQVDDEVLADPVAEKLRQQRLVEEADYKATTELFGKKGDEKSLDNFIPKSESDFAEYAELLSHKIRPYEKSFHYIGLLKAVIRLSMSSLKAADAKDIASLVTAIANEKLKAEKEANAGKKKQGGKKKQLHVDKPDDDIVPSIPFQLLIPIIRPHLDKDRAMQLQSVFTKLRTNEVSKEDFLRVIRNIVGDQMLRQAVNKVHMQIQAQAAKNQQTSPNQYSLQNQASQQQLLSRGALQFPDPRAFSSLNSMSSSQNQMSHTPPPGQPVSVSTVQMQMDSMFPPVENSGQKSQEIENSSDVKKIHASQMHSTSKNVVNPERETSMSSIHGISKQQQHPRPQTSFPMYGGSSSNFHSHPYARPPISAPTASLRSQPQDSQMRPSLHTQGMPPTQLGPVQPGNVLNVPKYELQNIGSEAKRLHGGPLTSHSTSQQLPVSWQPTANKEQRSTSLPSMPYVKQEVVDQVTEPQNKSQLTTTHASSFGPGHPGQGNPTLGSMNNDGMDKQSSRMGFSTSLNTTGSQAALMDSSMQVSPPLVAGTTAKTPLKKPSVGQKKPLESATSSAAASKKQKTSGAFHEQSIEHLNDVTAVSGVNLREEEEQLLSAPKEDSLASEATRRVVQEEEDRLILQKGPLQRKLADIMFKCGLKKINSDVERCLSMCVEERLRGVISSLIRLSKQRVDIEKSRHRFVITSDVHHHILEVNRKAKEEWDKKQAEEAEKLRKVNEAEGNAGSDGDKDKDDGRSKANKANKEEDDKMRATAANVAARAAVGGDDMLSKWQLMAEQARQKREGLDGPSTSQSAKATSSRPSSGSKRNLREQHETQRRGSSSHSISGGSRRFGRSSTAMSQSKVARNISRKDVIAVLEKEPQMSKSTLLYRLYEKLSGDSTAE